MIIPISKDNQGGATSADYSRVPENVTFNSGDMEKTFSFTADAGFNEEITSDPYPSSGSIVSKDDNVTLVSNHLDNGLSINSSVIGDVSSDVNQVSAQKFTTGSRPGSYTLVSVSFHTDSFFGTNINLQISIYSSGADDNPDSSLFVLTGMVETSGESTLTAPANSTLDASTSYFVVFEDTDSATPNGNFGLGAAEVSDEDGASLLGSSIDGLRSKNAALPNPVWTVSSGNPLALGIIGRTNTTVTISADKTSAVLKRDNISCTLTRTGPTADDLPVTVAATSFQHFAQGATVEGGTLTAAVLAGTGYVLGTPASVDVSIVVALTIGFEMASYSVAEEADTLEVKLVARTGSGAATPDASAFVSFSTTELDPLEARITQDYEPVSQIVIFAPSDFSVDGSVLIVDNAIDEQVERFSVLLDIQPGLPRKYHNFVDTNGAACQDTLCPTLVTIIDTDPVSADITGIEITSTPASGSFYETGEAITVAVTYDQTVAVNTTSGTPTLDLEIEVAQAASYTSISSDNLALTFSYTVAGDDQDQNGIVIPAGSIDLNGGAITRQGTSVAANLAYPRLGRDATQKVNKDPAVINGGVTITSEPLAKTDTYGVGEAIRFTVTFDTPVAVDTTSGTPVLGFRLANTGATPANKDLDYVSGSGTAVLTFEYVVQSGDTDTNGISVRNNWLDANGGAITHTTTGRAAKLNHGRPGNNGNFPGHKVDGSLGPSVPNDWVLKPSGLGGGDQFRLIFLTSLGHVGSDTDIEVYNDFVLDRAASGHAAIQASPAAFNVVGCTASTDARDNTHTTYTSSNKGVPIYWLNGNKVADEYEDFYDGSWDDEVNDKNQLGFNGLDTSNAANYPWTGCDHDGTKANNLALGDTTPRPASAGPTPPIPATAPSAASPQSPVAPTAPCTGSRRSSPSRRRRGAARRAHRPDCHR